MRYFFSNEPTSRRSNKLTRGALLIEILITISVLAVILSLGAQSNFVSLMASKNAAEKDTALNLAIETLEAVRSSSDEKWQNLYNLNKGSGNHYYPSESSGKWVIGNPGDETVSVNGINYSRYFFTENVSRDQSTRNIEASYNSTNDDPSTQKVTAVATPTNGNPVSISQHLSRWRNKVTVQTYWTGSGDTGNITTGSSLQLTQ